MPRRRLLKHLVLTLSLLSVALFGMQCPGLDFLAILELKSVGVDKYVGQFTPATSEDAGNGWTKHTFDTEGGDGPICIPGTPFTAFTKAGNPSRLLIFLNGGGACWQDFYFCSPLATDALPAEAPGIFADSFDTGSEIIDNPLADYSMMFVSYCDGSVFSGDNDVIDPNFPFGPVRFHRGLRNLTAAMDLAKDEFPNAQRVVVSGASAGGVGAAGFAPFIARFVFGNHVKLRVFNDAGPVAITLDQTAAIQARADDWQFTQFNPPSCTECTLDNQPTEIIKWRLSRDSTISEAFYSTDGDQTNRFFLGFPSIPVYRQLLLDVHGEIHDAYPDRYKRFIRANDTSHTALGTPLYYLAEILGTPLYEWTDDFIRDQNGWVDLIEAP